MTAAKQRRGLSLALELIMTDVCLGCGCNPDHGYVCDNCTAKEGLRAALERSDQSTTLMRLLDRLRATSLATVEYATANDDAATEEFRVLQSMAELMAEMADSAVAEFYELEATP